MANQRGWKRPRASGASNEVICRYRQCEGDRSAGRPRDSRRRHHQPVAARQGVWRLPQDPQAHLRDRPGAGQRRGRGHRHRRHAARGTRPRQHRRAHRRQGAVHEGRREGVQDALVRRTARQRHADLLGHAGLARRQGRRDLRQPVRRPARRHRHDRHEPDSRDRGHLRQLTSSRPRCSWPASATRFTSSRRRAWAPTWRPRRQR